MTIIQQTIIICAVIQLIFAFYEYKVRPDPIHVVTSLFQPKYLFSTVIICLFFLVIFPIFSRVIKWFFKL